MLALILLKGHFIYASILHYLYILKSTKMDVIPLGINVHMQWYIKIDPLVCILFSLHLFFDVKDKPSTLFSCKV